MNRPSTNACLLVFVMLIAIGSLSGCSSRVIKTTAHTPVIQETEEIPESQLMDVGIKVFDTGLDDIDEDDHIVFPEIRKAESRYIPVHLMNAIQSSAAWGAVRVIPSEQSAVDVIVDGKIVQSDGEMLILDVHVSDASGEKWFKRKYSELASRYAYDKRRSKRVEPFQNIYNRIANDILEYKRTLDTARIEQVRTISELRFAQSFSPEAFGGHLTKDKKGRYQVTRLPADNDPMLKRIRSIRERDHLFVDTLQDYYTTFTKEMKKPYQEWRRQSYDEVIAVRELQKSALTQKIAGVAAILGGIAAAGSDSGAARAAGSVGIAGGAYLIKSGFDKGSEVQIHIEALQELGDSLEADIEPQIIELDDRTITLSGTVENQYDQWRDILLDIYELDTGTTKTADKKSNHKKREAK